MRRLKAALKQFTLLYLAAASLFGTVVAENSICELHPEMSLGRQASSQAATGNKTWLYIRVAFPDKPTEPVSAEAAERLLLQVENVFFTNSYGKLRLTGTVTPLVTVPHPSTNYYTAQNTLRWNELIQDARAAARAAGYDTDLFDYDAVRFSSQLYRSSALIGRKGAWLVSSGLQVTCHELGHNLGLNHANAWIGDWDATGATVEYGNVYDVMGTVTNPDNIRFGAYNKFLLGWLSEGDVLRVTRSGVYRLHALDAFKLEAGLHYAVRIEKDWERDYWIEKHSNFQDREDVNDGAVVTWSPWVESRLGTHLLDVDPGHGHALFPGAQLYDRSAGVRVVPMAVAEDRSWIDLAITTEGSPRLLIGRDAADGAVLCLLGSGTFEIQSSPDLKAWQPVAIVDAAGDVRVPVRAAGRGEFYRAVPR